MRSFEIGRWILKQRLERSNILVKCPVTETPLVEPDSEFINDTTDLHEFPNENTENIEIRCDIPEFSEAQNGNNTSITTEKKKIKRKKIPEELRCKTCNKQCANANALYRHQKIHDESRPYVCSKCGKGFKLSQVLADHMRRHYDDRRFKCDECGARFYEKIKLTEHIRKHTGERPYKCDMCGNTFTRRYLLQSHMKVTQQIIMSYFICEFSFCLIYNYRYT